MPSAKMIVPDTVDDHPRGQWIGGARNLIGEVQPAASRCSKAQARDFPAPKENDAEQVRRDCRDRRADAAACHASPWHRSGCAEMDTSPEAPSSHREFSLQPIQSRYAVGVQISDKSPYHPGKAHRHRATHHPSFASHRTDRPEIHICHAEERAFRPCSPCKKYRKGPSTSSILR